MSYISEAIEKQVEGIETLDLIMRKPTLRPGVQPNETKQWKTDRTALQLAQPFYWNKRTVELVQALMGDFTLSAVECSREMTFCDYAWHWFGEASPFSINLRGPGTTPETAVWVACPVRAVCWYWLLSTTDPSTPFFGATAWCDIYRTPTGWAGPALPSIWVATDAGQKMDVNARPDHLMLYSEEDEYGAKEEMRNLRLFVVAASTFLRQELLGVEQHPLERHARKRLERRYVDGVNAPDINVVYLRRTSLSPKHQQEHPAGSEREWNWQWSVKGHDRQQWYPSLQKHLPVYIHPYMKGPEDKPIKPRSTPIVAVTR